MEDKNIMLQQLKKLVEDKPNSCQSSLSRNRKLAYLKKFLFDTTNFLEKYFLGASVKLKMSTRIWYLVNHKSVILQCKNPKCNKPLAKNISCVGAYVPQYCNDKCSQSDPALQLRARFTRKRLYGSETYNNSCKAKETRVSKNKGEYFSAESRKNISQHCSLRRNEVREKGKKTREKLYGNENFNNREKAKTTCKDKMGCENPSQNPAVKAKKENTFMRNYGVKHYWLSKESKEKSEQHCMQKYGAKIWFQSGDYKNKIHDVTYLRRRKEKEYMTKKKNNSFKSSAPEKEAYEMLKFIFPRLESQYASNTYPFNADFYDPGQSNVRFEFQGSWTHGQHPFDPANPYDVALVHKWKSKNTKFYDNAIDTWTRRDPLKRRVAEENGIVLIEFWSLEEVRQFVINYFSFKVNSN